MNNEIFMKKYDKMMSEINNNFAERGIYFPEEMIESAKDFGKNSYDEYKNWIEADMISSLREGKSLEEAFNYSVNKTICRVAMRYCANNPECEFDKVVEQMNSNMKSIRQPMFDMLMDYIQKEYEKS